MSALLSLPVQAQFWGSWDSRPPRPIYRSQPQQQYNPFGSVFGPDRPSYEQRREREAPVDNSRAPAPARKADTAPTTSIVVIGDAMADWLASGLEDAFSEKPEIGIVRKNRAGSGLVRYDPRRDVEMAQAVKEIVAAEKPKFIIMMIGTNDHQSIRERAATPARKDVPGKPGAPSDAPPQVDPEQQAQQSADQQNAEQQENQDSQDNPEQPQTAAPETAKPSPTGTFEFHTDKWEDAYVKRIDATIVAMKSAGVPVLWVGLPAQRNSRATTDAAYLNDLYRNRAEKAGIVYVDVWDGFVDDAGRYTPQGPDFEGQIRRLRSADGIYFTKAGARKLAHYAEREIQRNLTNRISPVAFPIEPTGPQSGPLAKLPANPSGRPVVGPVIPLTASAGGGNELLGGGPSRPSANDPVVTRVLTKGEPIGAPTGRADDFNWPRNGISVEPVPANAIAAPRANQATAQSAPAQRTAGQQANDADQPAPAPRRPRAPTQSRQRSANNPFSGLWGR